MDLFDYLETTLETFDEKPLNPVDSAALSQFCMVRGEGVIPAALWRGSAVERLRAWASRPARFSDLLRAERFDGLFCGLAPEGVKRELRDAFGGRVVTAAGPASRGSADGIRGGLADMYTLARTARIYASAGSSFSPMAARIGGVPLTELRTDRDGE